MKASDILTLEACLLTLVNAEVELPSDLQAQIKTLSQQLPSQDSATIQRLRELIGQHPDLQDPYDRARRTLQSQYHHQERTKSAIAPSLDDLNGGMGDLLQLATTLLSAEDIRRDTRRLFQGNPRRLYQQTPTALHPFLQTLSTTATTLPPLALALLRELDRDPCTPESLSFHLNLSPPRTQSLIRRLQREGYLCPLTGNFFNFALPLFGVYPPPRHPLREDTPLCLTAKGYFYLNPVISTHRSAA